MSTISINELVTQLATLGVVATAAVGSFHRLPGSGGTGPSPASNVRMIKATLNKAPGPTGFGRADITYGFSGPIEGPFVQVVESVLSDNVTFTFSFYPNPDGLTGVITGTAIGFESGSPTDEEWPKEVLVRIEPFEETVTPV